MQQLSDYHIHVVCSYVHSFMKKCLAFFSLLRTLFQFATYFVVEVYLVGRTFANTTTVCCVSRAEAIELYHGIRIRTLPSRLAWLAARLDACSTATTPARTLLLVNFIYMRSFHVILTKEPAGRMCMIIRHLEGV